MTPELKDRNPDDTNFPPFETEDLRSNLVDFLKTEFYDSELGCTRAVGSFTWGVYAFFDYDGEPIYVGQTKEKISTRIRRHLTNQRTDAVAMSVLDPFEVLEIEVWPLPQFERKSKQDSSAKRYLDALERLIHEKSVDGSTFKAILNEKDPPAQTLTVTVPPSLRGRLVSEDVYKIRSHPDFRTARRALVISRLAQVISERKVQGGLRRVLLTQAKRLQWLAERRYIALGGDASTERDESEDNDD